MSDANTQHPEPWGDGIAIIGMSARFPRAKNVDEYWARLVAGELLIWDLTDEQLPVGGVMESMLDTGDYVAKGNAIEDADCLDADLFGLSRREAETIDPQQRVFLECAWEAMEHAGYTGEAQPVGVFAGVGMNMYLLQLINNPEVVASVGAYQLMLANDKDFLATRAAYKLNLRGPAMVVQAACSTSLAAIHMGCRSLLADECELALAGGVAIPFPQNAGYVYTPGMILSKDGYCRPFDARANGTVPGRGAGIVVLKRLSRALVDNDTIYAVIRGSAWNNDGSGKVGYTVPSVEGQARAIREALNAAGIDARRIGFVEAHGTATELGDPIEFTALESVFKQDGARRGGCLIGAVKSNMGHADIASGVAGLIKAAMAVHTGVVPPTLHFESPNPYIDFANGSFTVNTSVMPWGENGERWAGVSSFGIGGTNVHVILGSAPLRGTRDESTEVQVFPLSARTASALASSADRLARSLSSGEGPVLQDVAATLQLGRQRLASRRAEVASSRAELIRLLREPRREPEARLDLGREVVFLLPGQGQQFLGMAPGLEEHDPVFRSMVEQGAGILKSEIGLDVRPWIGKASREAIRSDALQDTSIAQPVLFLLEYALAARWQSLGVHPSAVAGHSLGELTAVAIAGVFSFEDGLRLAAERGRLMAQTPPGLMTAVSLPSDRLEGLLGADLWIAAENSPRLTVVSGLKDAVESVERRLSAERVAYVRLSSRNAFHTPLMAEAAAAFVRQVRATKRQAPSIPVLSNVTGTWAGQDAMQDPTYWGRQMLSRVRFAQSLATLAGNPKLLIEVGPGDTLLGLARASMRGSVFVQSLGAESRKEPDDTIFARAVARVWECGAEIDWKMLHRPAEWGRVPLPTYPFERQRYWIDPVPLPSGASISASQTAHSEADASHANPQKREDIGSWFTAPYWKSTPFVTASVDSDDRMVMSWLVLSDGRSLSEAVLRKLRQEGREAISVVPGNNFAQHEDGYIIDPLRTEHFEQLWRDIRERERRPTGLLDFWTRAGIGGSSYDVLALLLRGASRQRQRLSQVEVVTEQLQSVFGEPIENVARAQVRGLLRSLPTELNGIRCRTVDIQSRDTPEDSLVASLVEEIGRTDVDFAVAFRGERRWVQDWAPVRVEEVRREPFRTGGVYLITGGLGGVGYSFAQYLLSRFGARVVLTGRASLEPREEWPRILNRDEPDAECRRLMRLQAFEASGGEVRYVSADVADPSAMQSVLQELHEQFGPLNGVLHAAGLFAEGRILSQDLVEAELARRPKVQGSMILAELVQGKPLDFFVMCSSVSALLPALNESAYAAANAFQDAFAQYCRTGLKLPAVAIAFGAWQSVGMAADAVVPTEFEQIKEDRLRNAMTPEEGVEVIRRVLSGWRDAQIAATSTPILPLTEPTMAPAPVTEMVSLEGGGAELETILEIWRDLLGHDEISPQDNFFELGGHSLLGTMVLARIRQRYGIVLSLRALFEAPTPRQLAYVLGDARQRDEAAVSTAEVEEGREEFVL